MTPRPGAEIGLAKASAPPARNLQSRRRGPLAAPATLSSSAGADPALVQHIRARPIPEISPPIIDPRTIVTAQRSPFVQGTLAISFDSRCDSSGDRKSLTFFEPQQTLSSDLPEPQAWVTSMAQALIEVMAGARPAPQVIRWTTPEVYSSVARRNAAAVRRGAIARQAIVRQVRFCEPADGVVEACAVVLDNGRVRALAMRLTGVDRRWVVSALQVG